MITKITIGNLAPNTTAEDLRSLFSTVCGVVSVELVIDKKTGKRKGYALMELISQGDVGKAVSEFNGYRLDKNRLEVLPYKDTQRVHSPRPSRFVEYKSYNESIGKYK